MEWDGMGVCPPPVWRFLERLSQRYYGRPVRSSQAPPGMRIKPPPPPEQRFLSNGMESWYCIEHRARRTPTAEDNHPNKAI